MHRRVRLLVLLLTLGGGALSARSGGAQQIPSPYRYIETGQQAGAFVGVLDAGSGRFELGPRGGTVAGLRYAIEVSGPFSLEGVARTVSGTRDVRDPVQPEGERELGEADVLLTSLEGRIAFSLTGRRTWNGVRPTVMAGGGVAWDLAGSSAIDERVLPEDRFDFGTSFLGILGAGLHWLPAEHVELRADGALQLWQLDTPQGYRNPDRDLGFQAVPESEWVSGLEATLGVAVRW